MKRFRGAGDRWGSARALMRLGKLAINQRNAAQAVPLLEESLALGQEVGDVWGIAYALNLLGHAAVQQRDAEHAAADTDTNPADQLR